MNRISRLTSLRWARITVHAVTVALLGPAAVAAAVSIGLDTAAPAAADTTSVSTPSSTAQTGQLLQLQIQMNHGENSQYTKVANIMKTKHDTVKNSIGNIR